MSCNKKRIVGIMFTWSWVGFVVRWSDGSQETFSPGQLFWETGPDRYQKLAKIAHRLDGRWQPVEEQD